MTEIKDSTHKDLFPVSSGAALATCSEDASKNGGKKKKGLKVSFSVSPKRQGIHLANTCRSHLILQQHEASVPL